MACSRIQVRSSRRIHSRRGFTFLEVMIVVTIMGIFSAMAVPFGLKFMKRMKMWGAASTIKRQLQMARMKGLADPYKHCGVYFNMAADSQTTLVFVEDVTNNNMFDDPLEGGNDKVYLKREELPKGIAMAWVVAPTDDVIVFRGDGSAKYSAQVKITDGLATRVVDVLASTGRIKTY